MWTSSADTRTGSTDGDVERVRDAGLEDDAIFELTVAAALGAGGERLRVGLSLLGREL